MCWTRNQAEYPRFEHSPSNNTPMYLGHATASRCKLQQQPLRSPQIVLGSLSAEESRMTQSAHAEGVSKVCTSGVDIKWTCCSVNSDDLA